MLRELLTSRRWRYNPNADATAGKSDGVHLPTIEESTVKNRIRIAICAAALSALVPIAGAPQTTASSRSLVECFAGPCFPGLPTKTPAVKQPGPLPGPECFRAPCPF